MWTPCRSCVNQSFEEMYRLHLQGRKIRERVTSVSRWLQTEPSVENTQLYKNRDKRGIMDHMGNQYRGEGYGLWKSDKKAKREGSRERGRAGNLWGGEPRATERASTQYPWGYSCRAYIDLRSVVNLASYSWTRIFLP
jgi:hypothetical protein